jgi:plastocyanin
MRRFTLTLAGLTLAGLLAACSSASGAVPSPAPSAPPSSAPGSPVTGTVSVSATGMKFDQASIALPAGSAFTIAFDNSRGSAPHNVEIRDASGQKAFEGEIIDGGKTATYQVPALAAGSYSFLCTLHPDMKGTASAG